MLYEDELTPGENETLNEDKAKGDLSISISVGNKLQYKIRIWERQFNKYVKTGDPKFLPGDHPVADHLYNKDREAFLYDYQNESHSDDNEYWECQDKLDGWYIELPLILYSNNFLWFSTLFWYPDRISDLKNLFNKEAKIFKKRA